MSIRWLTDNNLGIVEDGYYIERPIEAVSTVTTSGPIYYQLISGSLPNGLSLSTAGIITGVPVVRDIESDLIQQFTVRAQSMSGTFADRTFTITVSSVQAPTIVTQISNLGSYYDGSYFKYQLEGTDPHESADLKWSLVRGRLPPGITLSKAGLLEGFFFQNKINYAALSDIGWDLSRWDRYFYDYVAAQSDSDYEFTVELTDGITYSRKTFVIRVIPKTHLTGDFTYFNINDAEVTVDQDQKHLPFITTRPQRLPEIKPELARQGTYFAFKFEGVDFDKENFKFEITTPDQRGFDQDGDEENHSYGTGFDMDEFDSSDYPMPTYIGLNNDTGWYTGYIKEQVEYQKDYEFQVYARKANDLTLRGHKSTFMLTVLGQYDEVITWLTDSDLGVMDNGAISGKYVQAKSNSGRTVYYKLKSDQTSRTPQGIILTEDGMLSGRTTFNYIQFDQNKTTIDSGRTTFDEIYEFTIVAETRRIYNRGSNVVGIAATKNDLPTKFRGYPGNEYLTAVDRHVHEWTGTEWLDKGLLNTLVQVSAYSEKTFKIRINRVNIKPYENLYLRGFPTASQRIQFNQLIANQDIFPDQLIFRINDPWYGKAKNLKFLFLPGVNPLDLEKYEQALSQNHYTKTLLFGDIKTAVALDDNYNIAYEVVYLDVIDEGEGLYNPKLTTTLTQTQSTNLISKNSYVENNVSYTQLSPNGLNNMTIQIETYVGLANKNTLPQWMSSPQPDPDKPGQFKEPPGFVRAIVLAYTVPGASKLIAYRLRNANFTFNKIPFTTDRYQLDNYLTQYWDKDSDQFIAGAEVHFDQSPSQAELYRYCGVVDYAVTVPYEKIHNQTVDYINFYNCIDGKTDWQDGDTIIFAQQENFQDDPLNDYVNYDVIGNLRGPSQDLRYWPQRARNIAPPYDLFDSNLFDQGRVGFERWVNDNGIKLPLNKWLYKNNGWLNELPFDAESFGRYGYSFAAKVPGYIEHILENKENLRSAVYKIRITNDIVTLELERKTAPGDIVRIKSGATYANKQMYFEPYVRHGNVPRWWVLTQKLYINPTNGESLIAPHKETTFDNRGTRFFSNRDQYSNPDKSTKYIKFPKNGVFK